jgi:hypothetical protein
MISRKGLVPPEAPASVPDETFNGPSTFRKKPEEVKSPPTADEPL